ncbi:iron complex outermembrane recepter protein [Maribacter sedimenticola]|uniref:Iron complex outermembrane recepter protein n=1 Tax=Maribacter sedimenticola TaxID=228956 RepID=A0ABY1SI90_9FLAO|nr:TonB-dependent receptor [Maribacter sedimenticola]SNR57108.1 iron complex outermembrane recepter protein [Maribacter sedimenticola]
MKTTFTLVFSVIFCINLLAQNTILKDSVTQLKEVIVIDTLTAKNAIGIIPSKIIGASVFNNYSPVDFIGALNQVSGVYALSGALNTNRITIRGVGSRTPFGTDKLRLYYNDIPVTNGTGFSTIEAYDLENLTSVEIIKGPKGTGFGTNLGGAIILNTKQPSNRPTTFSNKTTLGSYGLFKNNLGFSHHQKDLYLSFQYGHMEIDGYRENNRFERDGYLLNSIYSISNKSEIGLLINHIDYSAQIASSINQSDFDEDPTQAAFTWKNAQGYEDNNYSLIGVSHTYRPTTNLTNTSSVFYTYLDHYEPRPFNILDEYTNGFGFRSLFSGNFNAFQKTLSYTIGGELYKDEYTWAIFENLYEQNNGNGSFQGDRLNDNKEFRTQINGFATLGYSPLKNLAAQIGLNINKTQYDFRDRFTTGEFNKSAQRNFKTLLLPSLDLNYTPTALSQIYVNISRGYSNPSLEETLTPEGVINPDIKQEIGMNYEVGTKLTDREKKMHLNIAIYLMPINNLLVAKRIGEDQYIGRNAGKTEHKGLDIDWNYVFNISPRISIAPFLNYSFSAHRFVEFEDEEAEQDYAGNSLTGVPKHRINFGLQTSFGNGFFANLTHQFVDRIPLTDANSIYSNSFHLLNTKLGYGSPINDHLHLSVQLGVNNIADTKYAQSVLINASSFGGSAPRYFYPGNNTNLYGGVQLKYSL